MGVMLSCAGCKIDWAGAKSLTKVFIYGILELHSG